MSNPTASASAPRRVLTPEDSCIAEIMRLLGRIDANLDSMARHRVPSGGAR